VLGASLPSHNSILTPPLNPSTNNQHQHQPGVANLVEKGYKKISPFFIPYAITNMGGALLAIDTGFMGPNYSISTACATANYAYVSAANHIRNGEADLMVVGGSEAPIIPVGLGGFVACRALSTRNDEPTKASRCVWFRGSCVLYVLFCFGAVGKHNPHRLRKITHYNTPPPLNTTQPVGRRPRRLRDGRGRRRVRV
jgi:hypothetical protein